MAQRAGSTALKASSRTAEAVDYYRTLLARPAALPESEFDPIRIGPTWQVDEDGVGILPKLSLGMECLVWCYLYLQHGPGDPWKFTTEQARFLMHWYAIDERGRYLYRDGVLQRLKGWGKDPVGACICAFEMLGPCRFDDWDSDGFPVAKSVAGAWVQTAAVALSQTRNTMQLFDAGLFTEEAIKHYRLTIGVEFVRGIKGSSIQAVTSSPSVLQGNRATFVLLNETHEWNSSNGGHRMSEVLALNATKSPDGAARTLRITNAYQPGQDSVAERDRDAYEKARSGQSLTSGLLYDSLEASPQAPLTVEAAPLVVPTIRGDSIWLQVDRIVESILDTRNPPSQSRRYWYNQIVAAEDAWITPQEWDLCRDEARQLTPGDQISLFFDGSKSDDATGLMACRISDGHLFTMGVWQRPEHVQEWTVPRTQVADMVDHIFVVYDVRGFFADPGTGEDELGERYWDGLIDRWSNEYGEKLDIWAVQTGPKRHAVMWDMRSEERRRLFTEAAERTYTDITGQQLTHDGHPVLRIHVTNARRAPNKYGVSITKEHRESSRKIDLAVCAIGARMLQRMHVALPANKKRHRPTGRAVFAG